MKLCLVMNKETGLILGRKYEPDYPYLEYTHDGGYFTPCFMNIKHLTESPKSQEYFVPAIFENQEKAKNYIKEENNRILSTFSNELCEKLEIVNLMDLEL